jgi:hypothetical protein
MLNNLSKGWQHIKGCHSKDDQRAQNVVIPMVAIDSIQNIQQTNLLTRIHYKNFKRGMERRLCLESRMDNALWVFSDKTKRRDSLSSNVKDLVVQFWTKYICVNPNMRDVVRRRLTLKVLGIACSPPSSRISGMFLFINMTLYILKLDMNLDF